MLRPSLRIPVLLGLALLFLLAGCGRVQNPGLEKFPPRRIISAAPSATEMLDALGLFDRVVAVSDYCTYPQAVQSKERIGGWQNTSIEKIMALKPDLVILNDAQEHLLGEKLQALDIPSLAIATRSLADIYRSIEAIGAAAGVTDKGKEVAATTRGSVEAVRERTHSLPKPSVLVVVDRTPGTLREMYTASKGSFLAELVEAAGGRPLAPATEIGYGRVTKETLFEMNPDIIIDMTQHSPGAEEQDLLKPWRQVKELRAVREGRVFPVREDYAVHPSPFVTKTVRLLAERIHPDVFGPGSGR